MSNLNLTSKSLQLISCLLFSTAVFAADYTPESLTMAKPALFETEVSKERVFNLKPSRGESLKWVKEREHDKDIKFKFKAKPLPASIDLSNEFPAIHDQGDLGSCTAQAITLAMEYNLKKKNDYTQLSPLYVYYNEREMEGTVEEDVGASIADGIKSVCTDGACREETWSYDDKSYKFTQKPPIEAYIEAKSFLKLDDISHSHIPHDLMAIKSVLASRTPVVFGITVFTSFDTKQVEKTGYVPMPKYWEKPKGGHALTLVGYDDHKKEFKFANSWGTQWGDNGYGYITYDYIMNKSHNAHAPLTYPDEFWSISRVGKRDV